MPPAPAQPVAPSALTLAHSLSAKAVALAVLLPHLPAGQVPIPQTQLTGLGNLDPQLLATTQRPAGAWQAPAAPYAGAASPPPAPAEAADPTTAAPPAADSSFTVTTAAPRPLRPAAAGGLEQPELAPAGREVGAEPGPAEASALSQPADELTLPEPEPTIPTPADSAARQPLVRALAALRNDDDESAADLNFRVIQYARFAAPQAAGQEFAVIYAADWPAWLAALEIRQLTGRPLVLHVQSLAADRNTPADRGWALELERLTLRRADLILAATPAVADRLQATYGFAAGRCRVVAPDDTQALYEVLNSFSPAD
ncbi:glycosyltransferase family 4 protein [Hymenobacter persicinus]|uniref:Glycosyltransferase subfamily 4-like N-terminal domain-containing protein n=1 Tax=Hymenobacter persicinus TaxID=2025506 RepID=A0A4Q5LAS2_9BACT|nr:glycosyltransferase family 4 protein [Hymenobacter persicinus]RYU79142.1 hypothetical protein EWM57_11455 [Hymenobacter persicinus]